METGDEIKNISGIFSGTLAYLFNVFDGQRPFSEIVREARALGYTEPDPREDLSGMDVARKAVILAREAGLSLELSDIEVESLVPESLIGVSLEHFMEELAVFDAPMAEKHEQAKRKNCLLRYAADLNLIDGTVGVKLGYYPPDHAFSSINFTDNSDKKINHIIKNNLKKYLNLEGESKIIDLKITITIDRIITSKNKTQFQPQNMIKILH